MRPRLIDGFIRIFYISFYLICLLGDNMIITTTFDVPGKKIGKILGLVKGNTIRARHVGRDIMASLKTIVGGEIKSYTQLLNSARDEAITRMKQEAKKLNADAVVGVRMTTNNVMQGSAEVLAYGTAVKFGK